MASVTDAMQRKGLTVRSQVISGQEKARIAHKRIPMMALSGHMDSDTKFGEAWVLQVDCEGSKRDIYFSPGDHIDDQMEAIIEATETEPVGPFTLYAYPTKAGGTGYGIEELSDTTHTVNAPDMDF